MTSKKKQTKKAFRPTAERNEMLKVMLSNKVPGIPGLNTNKNVRKIYKHVYNNTNEDMMSKDNTIKYIIQKAIHDGVYN